MPVAYLKTLAGHGELFLKLPYSVQRQVWEMDRKLLQQHMLPLINGCAYESCMLSSLLDMDDTLPLTRTFKRAGTSALTGFDLLSDVDSRGECGLLPSVNGWSISGTPCKSVCPSSTPTRPQVCSQCLDAHSVSRLGSCRSS